MSLHRTVRLLRAPLVALFCLVLIAAGVAPAEAQPEHGHASDGSFAPRLGPGSDSKSVDRLYHAYFGRQPEPAGLAYWNHQVSRGVPLAHVSLLFTDTPEFRATYGHLDDPGFVRMVYRNVMDRDPDAPGFAHWTSTLAQRRLSRGGVMLSFSDSAEYKSKTGLHDPPSATAPPGGGSAPPGSFSIALTHNNKPVRWNPCAPIDVVVNLSEAPNIRPQVVDALASLTAATGVQWRLVGDTTEQLAFDGRTIPRRNPDLTARLYGPGWAPVLLTVTPQFNSGDAGLGTHWAETNRHSEAVFVTGAVAINKAYLSASHVGPTDIQILLMHELAHVFGLGHTHVAGQLMHPVLVKQPVWGAGDLAGFRELTKGGCLEVPPARRI